MSAAVPCATHELERIPRVMLRHALAVVAALTVTAALAPSAHAWTNRITFSTQRGAPALITVDTSYANTRLEVVRKGTIIRHGFTDELEVTGLLLDDVVNLYVGSGDMLVASATYDATPTINETACIGQTGFNVKKAAGAQVLDAGAFEPFADGYRPLPATWDTGDSFTVRLPRALQAGDVAYAATYRLTGDTEIRSSRAVPVLDCPYVPKTDPGPPQTPAPAPTQSPAAPTNGQVLQAVKASVGASGTSLRPLRLPRLAKRRAVAVPFAFPEPGTVKLELVAKGKTIGAGTKSSTANGKLDVAVKLTDAGRKLFKRTKKQLKVTVRGTFTPSRAGGNALSAASTVTLKR
jgi:hypothetical protein